MISGIVEFIKELEGTREALETAIGATKQYKDIHSRHMDLMDRVGILDQNLQNELDGVHGRVMSLDDDINQAIGFFGGMLYYHILTNVLHNDDGGAR
jgi:hypothetical protein